MYKNILTDILDIIYNPDFFQTARFPKFDYCLHQMTGRDKCYSAAPPDKASLKTMTLP
jgi:hypothetical protein